jgi:hypothetical protein
MMDKERIREIGLTGLFLLFVALMYTDIPDFTKKPAKDSQVLAANTKESDKKKLIPTPSTKPTTTPNPKYYVTWTPTPAPSVVDNVQSVSESQTEQSASSDDGSDNSENADISTSSTPQPKADRPSDTTTPTPQVQPTTPVAQPTNSEPARGGGILDDVTDILDPLGQLPL